MKTYKTISYYISLALLLILIYTSCGFHKYVQYTDYNKEISKNLPDTFRIELPLQIKNNHFYIQGRINHQYDMDFIIDTKAICLFKQDDMENLKASYWGTLPVKSLNAYGQKHKDSLYFFDSFEIQSLSFGQPIFKGVVKGNAIYEILSNKNAGVLGNNILSLLFWKFSIDEKKMVLFSNKDSDLIEKETEGYTKIENGIKIMNLNFPPLQDPCKFQLDLGDNGEIEINKKTFNLLSKQFPYKKVLSVQTKTISDTIYVFENIDVRYNDFLVPNCQLIYRPFANLSLIGTQFIQRFNFILAYGRNKSETQKHGIGRNRDLYIKPISDFHTVKSVPYISSLGFSTGILDKNLIISDIEIGSIAERSGLQIRDEILNLDNLDIDNYSHRQFITYISDKESVIVKVRRNGIIIDIPIKKLKDYPHDDL